MRKEFIIMNKKNLTKAELKTVLEGYANVVKEKSLKDRISYTLKKYSNSTKKTVLDLISDIETTVAPLPVENSVKKLPAKKTKTEKATEPEKKPEEKTAKPASKKNTSKGKAKPKLSAPKSTKGATDKSAPMAAIFPEKIEDENIGTLVAVPNKYHTIKELREAIESGEKTLVIGAYFPVPLIKKYGYSNFNEANDRVPKKGFAHDLDLQQVIYCCEGINAVYALSDYTEAMFVYRDQELKPEKVKDSTTGDTVATRFANGCEFELYEVITEAE